LLVEDHPKLKDVMTEMVAHLGYQVLAVTTGEQALEAIAHEEFSALVTDINLPGISGIELAKVVFARCPSTKIIFMSGDGYLVSSPLPFPFTLMAKPVYLANLRDSLRKLDKQQPPKMRTAHRPDDAEDAPAIQ
jgi:DNA-binding NtrC family response regulator